MISEGRPSLQFKLFIRRRASATQGTPPGKEDLKWVANTTTLIYGERDALLVDTFLSNEQTAELADWIAASGWRLSMIYITHGHPDHFFGLKLLHDRFPGVRAVAMPQVVDAMEAALQPKSLENWRRRFPELIPEFFAARREARSASLRSGGEQDRCRRYRAYRHRSHQLPSYTVNRALNRGRRDLQRNSPLSRGISFARRRTLGRARPSAYKELELERRTSF